MNHKELFGKDLSGWKLTTAYVLELVHGNWGFFPAIYSDNPSFFPAIYSDNPDQPVMCIDKELMTEVGKLLTPRRCACIEFMVLANEKLGISFDTKIISRNGYRYELGKDTHLFILTREKFDELKAKSGNKSPFKWAPGLVSTDITQEEFIEALAGSLREN